MSKKAAAAAAPAEGEKPKGKSKLIIIIVAAVVLLAAAGGAAYFFLFKKGHGEEAEAGGGKDKPAAEKKHSAEPGKPPAFIALEPFTSNLMPENGNQIIQLTISLKVEDAHEGDKVKGKTVELRDRILYVLATKKPSELAGREGREQLADEIKDAVNSIVGTPGGTDKKGKKTSPEGPVDEALFTSFIIQ